jgi:hypothetical protein
MDSLAKLRTRGLKLSSIQRLKTGPSSMTQTFRRILCPIDFDDNSMAALEVACKGCSAKRCFALYDGTLLRCLLTPPKCRQRR